MRKTLIGLTLGLLLGTAAVVMGQGTLSNQVLRLLVRNNTWSGTNVFSGNVTISGTCTGCTGTGASLTAPYILATATAGYVNAQALGALSSGILKVASPSGVLSSVAAPVGAIVGTTDTQALSNKTGNISQWTNDSGYLTSASLTTNVTGILPRANGGTGLSTATDDTTLVGSGSAWVATALSNCLSGAFTYTTSGNTFGCNSYIAVGTTGTPSSSNIRLKETTAGLLSVRLGDDSGDGSIGAKRLALGTAGDTTFAQSIYNMMTTWTGTADATVQDVDVTFNPSGNTSGDMTAARIKVDSTNSANFTNALEALIVRSDYNGGGTVTGLYALDSEGFPSAGTITTNYGAYIFAGGGGTSSITNNYGAFIDTPTKGTALTNHYGLYLNDQTLSGTTLDYALFYAAPSSKTLAVKANGDTAIGSKLYMGTTGFSGPTLEGSTGAAAGACTTGSIKMRSDGGAGTSVYYCDNAVWAALNFSSAAGITSGQLATARGGTGLDGSGATNGQLLIGNGSGFTLATLTGTANQVTVTNGAGSITLATPQSIGTASAPQFARIGLGTGAGGTAVITTTGQFDTGYYNNGSQATAVTVNWNNGMLQKVTLAGAPVTVTLTNPITGVSYTLVLIQDGSGSRTVTWPGSVLWTGGSAPTLTATAAKKDIITLLYDGTNYLGSSSLNY